MLVGECQSLTHWALLLVRLKIAFRQNVDSEQQSKECAVCIRINVSGYDRVLANTKKVANKRISGHYRAIAIEISRLEV